MTLLTLLYFFTKLFSITNTNNAVENSIKFISVVLTLPYIMCIHVMALDQLHNVQQIQNVAAWLVLGLDRREKRLHWLPVKYSILFKLVTLMHQCLHRCCPAYMMDITTFHDSDTAVYHLRSSATQAAVVKWTRTQFGQRAFSVAGPDIWNSLPPEIRLTRELSHIQKETQNSSVSHSYFLTFAFILVLNFDFTHGLL